jgi:hypothetical protein
MANYGLVNRDDLTEIANKFREYGYTGELIFPSGFTAAIDWLAQNSIHYSENLTLNGVDAVSNIVEDSSGNVYSNYYSVGHSTSKIKNDAVWSFTPSISATKAVVTLSWNNNIGSVGWSG